MLQHLRSLLASHGRLSTPIIDAPPRLISSHKFIWRFGRLDRAYELIGYGRAEHFSSPVDLRRKTQALREELIARIAAMFPDEVSITRPGGQWRTRLQLRSGLMVSVLIGRPIPIRQTIRWRIDTAKEEYEFVTLLARLDKENRSFLTH